jgi:hypothetical protein
MTEQSSNDGTVTLQVPASWKVSKIAAADLDLELASMRDNFAIIETHQAVAEFPPQADLDTFLAAIKKVYVERHSGVFGATNPRSSVAGLPGYKVAVDCELGDVPARGYLFVMRSGAFFHMFAVLTAPEYAKYLDGPVSWIEQGRIRSARATAP